MITEAYLIEFGESKIKDKLDNLNCIHLFILDIIKVIKQNSMNLRRGVHQDKLKAAGCKRILTGPEDIRALIFNELGVREETDEILADLGDRRQIQHERSHLQG